MPAQQNKRHGMPGTINMKTFEQFLDEQNAKIPLDGQYGVKMALKRAKNASDVTKKAKDANPTHKMPAGSSQHAAYSESEFQAMDEYLLLNELIEMGISKHPSKPGKHIISVKHVTSSIPTQWPHEREVDSDKVEAHVAMIKKSYGDHVKIMKYEA